MNPLWLAPMLSTAAVITLFWQPAWADRLFTLIRVRIATIGDTLMAKRPTAEQRARTAEARTAGRDLRHIAGLSTQVFAELDRLPDQAGRRAKAKALLDAEQPTIAARHTADMLLDG